MNMSSTPSPADSTTPSVAPPVALISPFDDEELLSFAREDNQAGKVIASLLGFFFLYTVVVTSVAAWWTWEAVR